MSEANLARERDYLKAVIDGLRAQLQSFPTPTQFPLPAPPAAVGSKRKLATPAHSIASESSSAAASSSGVPQSNANQNRVQNAKALVESLTPLLGTQIATLPRDECRAYLAAMGPGLQGGNTDELRASLARVFRVNRFSSWKKGDPVNLSGSR